MEDTRLNIIGLSRAELESLFLKMGEKSFRAKQLWGWIYAKGENDFAAMSNIARPLQEKLAASYKIERPKIVRQLDSVDGTRKWLFEFADGNQAESVYIPDMEEDGGAVCLSSQVGCTLTCQFCHTGTQTLVRDLTAGEIVGQFMAARDSYRDWPQFNGNDRLLTNVVLMGMGEPLFNYDNVLKALKILMDEEGMAVSKRKITLSTAGVVPMIKLLGEDAGVNLAISLHATNNELRSRLMPINKKYPLEELLAACRDYQTLSNSRRITFAYILIKDVNDRIADAKELVRLVHGIPAKFNLIPFNHWPDSSFECSTPEKVQRFAEILRNAGYPAPVRQPRGQDIMAACGQLRSDSQREKLSRHRARLAAGIEDESED